MKIVFIDESGQPGGYNSDTGIFNEKSSKYFVLGSFMIDTKELLFLETQIKDIKIKYGLSPHQELKWNCSYSKLNMPREDYYKMRKEIIDVISWHQNSVIAIVIDKKEFYKKKYINNHNDLYTNALHLLMERVCMNLNDEKGEPVMFFTDSRKNDKSNLLDKEIQISYLRAKNMGTNFVRFPNFSESIVFIDSQYCIGVQLADFCAGIISNTILNDYDYPPYDMLLPAIRKHNGKVEGYGIKIRK